MAYRGAPENRIPVDRNAAASIDAYLEYSRLVEYIEY